MLNCRRRSDVNALLQISRQPVLMLNKEILTQTPKDPKFQDNLC
jgi:hypothetical protein